MAAELSPRAQKALKLFEDGCVGSHKTFVQKMRQRMSDFHGILDQRSSAAQWGPQLHPPFIEHIVESALASLIDGKLAYRVKPKPRLLEPGEFEGLQQGARAHEALHAWQLAEDRFHEMQHPFALQDAVVGITAAKNYYRRDVRMKPRLKVVPDDRAAGYGIFLPRLVEEEALDICHEGPTTEVVNMEDFFWHEAAVELQRSPVIAHRVFMSYSELERLQANGIYQNVDELKSAGGSTSANEQRVVDGTSRTRDMVEVLEIWWEEPDAKWVVTIGNGAVELRAPKKNPFWHGDYPFVTCTTRPDLFTIPGRSQVERIAHLQEAHWDLENQTRQNVRLLNNAIFMIGDEAGDVDAFELAPGARWPVEGNPNETIMSWTPNALPADLALVHLDRLEAKMQNLAGGHPFTSTSEARVGGADTATEAALTTNIAERATIRLKEQLAYSYERIGQHRTELNQQFLRREIMVEKIGIDSQSEWLQIAPYLLQGAYMFDIAPMVESLMRSERRAEKNALFQTFLQAASLYMELANVGAAKSLNADEFAREWLEGYDLQDVDRFFSAKQQPALPPGAPSQPGQPDTGLGPSGVTAPQSIDPAVSPSAQASMSGEAHMAQLGRMRGGASNT